MEERSKAFSIWQIDKNGGGPGVVYQTPLVKRSVPYVLYTKSYMHPCNGMSINLSLVGPTANTPRRDSISDHVQSVDPLWENAYRQSTRGDDEGGSFSAVCVVLTTMHFSEN